MAWFKKTHKKSNDGSLAARLQTERTKSDIILSAIETGVVVIDASKAIQLINPAAARLTGWTPEEAIGIDYKNVIHLITEKDVDYTEAQDPFKQAFDTAKTIRDNTASLAPRTGPHPPINVSVSPLFEPGTQNVTGVVGIFSDVTEQRREERQRAEFISTASHEMRTPVAAIEGYLALAMNEKVASIDTKARDYLVKAHTSTQHLGKLFQDLLTSARAEDGRLSNHPVVVEMASYMQQVTEDVKFSAEKKGMLVEFVIGSSNNAPGTVGGKVINPLYYAKIDPDRMREVITNLFDNAVKYSDQGKISIGITGNDQIVQLYIRDTGHGIPAADIPHLFQKFYRVDSSAIRTFRTAELYEAPTIPE
jgi:two-component system sensor histidine kinase VicK